MNKKKSIVIVDDNESLSILLEEHLNKTEGFEVIATAKDGDQGLKLINVLLPDIVILDMVMPKADGLTVLENLYGGYGPDIIILSAIGHDIITKRAMSLGAMYYIIKPFEIQHFIDRMNQLFYGKVNEEMPRVMSNVSMKLEEVIAQELNYLGVPMHLKGYHYLKAAIQYVATHGISGVKVTKDIYPLIADTNETTASNVERAIRHAIDLTLSRGSIDVLEGYFRNEFYNNKITNKEFIVGIAETVKSK